MAETVKTYLLSDPETMIPMDRDEFYAEQIAEFKKNGKPTRATDIIDVFIFNSDGELLIQKRSYDKAHNPGMLDKSIGGHVTYGDPEDFTVMVETVQELQTPSIVLRNTADFQKTLKLLKTYLDTISIIKHSESEIVLVDRLIKGEVIQMAKRFHIYFGIYDGRVKPVDKEAKGVLWYTLDEVEKEMKEFPKTFTGDMHMYMKRYRKEMEEFLSMIKQTK